MILNAQQTYFLELQIQLYNSAAKRSEVNSQTFEYQCLANQEMIILSILKQMTNEEVFGDILDKRDSYG